MPTRVRIVFRRVNHTRAVTRRGSGELTFHFTVNGIPIGDAEQEFRASSGRYIELSESIWSGVDVVERDSELRVEMQVRDDDRAHGLDYGRITHILRGPWLPNEFVSPNENFTVEWGLELEDSSRWVRYERNEVFACREHQGSVTCTTVSGRQAEVRLEFHPVRPVPRPPPPDVEPPVRPLGLLLSALDDLEAHNRGKTRVEPGSPLNVISNPPVIPVLAHPTDTTAAQIEYTYYFPASMDFTEDDPRLEWSAIPLNGGAVSFLGPPRGTKVLVYGTEEGEVLLQVRLRGALIATYRALVLRVRRMKCRFNLLDRQPPQNPLQSTPDNVSDHLRCTNRYLRQLALELELDDNPHILHVGHLHAATTTIPGIFRIQVPAGLTRNVNDRAPQGERAAILNYRPGVMNFVYIQSSVNGAFLGVAIDHPRHPNGNFITDDGSPSTSWVKPSGVEPDGAARPVRMRLIRGSPRAGHPRLFSMLVSEGDHGDPVAERDLFASTLAHEFGHILNLGHRNLRRLEPVFDDRVHFPLLENVMCSDNSPRMQDFDIIQARAAHASRIVTTESVAVT